jgi:hypothetical protein
MELEGSDEKLKLANWLDHARDSMGTMIDSQLRHSPQATSCAPYASAANATVTGVPSSHFWANTVLASIGCIAGVAALALVMTKLDDYSDRIQREERLKTQAIDEQRMENRYIARSLGIQGSDIQDHDISEVLRKLQEKRK